MGIMSAGGTPTLAPFAGGGGGGSDPPSAADPAARQWFYVDPRGETQGPCSIAHFHVWLRRLQGSSSLRSEYEQFRAVTVWRVCFLSFSHLLSNPPPPPPLPPMRALVACAQSPSLMPTPQTSCPHFLPNSALQVQPPSTTRNDKTNCLWSSYCFGGDHEWSCQGKIGQGETEGGSLKDGGTGSGVFEVLRFSCREHNGSVDQIRFQSFFNDRTAFAD